MREFQAFAGRHVVHGQPGADVHAGVRPHDGFPLFLRDGGLAEVKRFPDGAMHDGLVLLVPVFLGGRAQHALTGRAEDERHPGARILDFPRQFQRFQHPFRVERELR